MYFLYYLEGGSERARARARVAMAIFLFYSLSSSPLSADAPSALCELSVCVCVRVMSKTLLDAHPCYRRRLCRPATAAATAPAALAQRFGSPNYCELQLHFSSAAAEAKTE